MSKIENQIFVFMVLVVIFFVSLFSYRIVSPDGFGSTAHAGEQNTKIRDFIRPSEFCNSRGFEFAIGTVKYQPWVDGVLCIRGGQVHEIVQTVNGSQTRVYTKNFSHHENDNYISLTHGELKDLITLEKIWRLNCQGKDVIGVIPTRFIWIDGKKEIREGYMFCQNENELVVRHNNHRDFARWQNFSPIY